MSSYKEKKNAKAVEWAQSILREMTLEEKLKQLASFFPNGNPRLGVPHIQQGECLHGAVTAYATSFPQALALGSTWDMDLIERTAGVIAKECRASGIHHCFTPMFAVVRDPRWGRVQEAYGEDAYHVSQIGLAFTNGLQGVGDEYLDKDHIMATAKHYVADGEPLGGLNGAAMEISERSLREVHLPPFKVQVEQANVASVMPAHHSLNGTPCHSNKWLLQDILRDEYGFDGVVVSDNGDLRKLHTALYVSENSEQSAIMSLEAGVDTELAFLMPWGENRMYGPQLQKAVQEGRLSEDTIDKSVMRVLIKKYELGLLEDETADPNQESLEAVYKENEDGAHISMAGKANYYGKAREDRDLVCYDKAHDELALEAGKKSLILLQNRNKDLPLDKGSIKSMAVIGPNADRLLLGNYSTDKPKYFVSVLDGIRNYLSGEDVEILYSQALDQNDYSKLDIDEAVNSAQSADVTLLVLGGNEITCMENQDTDDLCLKGDQQELLEAVSAVSKKLILLIIDGRPSSIEWAKENVDSILLGFYLGQETGNAAAQVIFGEHNPSAKLPITVPRNVGQVQCHYNTYWPGRAPSYYNSPVQPLYPFGHGLSYTQFEISKPHLSKQRYKMQDNIVVSVDIKNTGDYDGEETVQLYITDVIASLVRPMLELKAFKKVYLSAGQSTTITFTLTKEDFAFWKDNAFITEPGEFIIRTGSSCVDLKEEKLYIE